ncbi:imelysin family protein [Granulosicoccus sp. 3-233]|uniref:imelysin family protein n=1 Tax=Granulosicoccus sp. 3-233 TaxID=3417969 RepID=UPI003D34CDBB
MTASGRFHHWLLLDMAFDPAGSRRRAGLARNALSALLAAALLMLPATRLRAAEFQATPQLSANWVQDVYQPAFRRFANAADAWTSTTKDLCESGPASRIHALQTDFTRLLQDYARVEIFRSGPMLDNHLQNRLFYWPDKRRVGERQLRSLLADTDIASLSVRQLARKSVAVQGFPALERLLFSDGHYTVEETPLCHVVQTLIQNIASMADELDRAWQSDSEYVQAFLHPEPSSPHFRNANEALRSVITEIVTGLDSLVDRKLQTLLSGDPRIIRTAPLWRSRRTVAMLTGNVAGIRSLLFDAGLLQQLAMEDELTTDFDYVDHLLGKLQYTFAFAGPDGQLSPEVDTVFASLSAVLNDIRHTVNHQVLTPLGMGVNFNADDGD